MTELVFSVSEFVALLNQTLEYAYPSVTVTGELANFRISKNRWVYFDLKDDESTVRFFGTVYQLPGPLEDGMLLVVKGMPRLHPQYGFSVTVQSMQPVGEGSIKKAAALLQAKLEAEGLFDPSRKRALPYPPRTVGLIASGESAAYRDFIKILNARWGGVAVTHVDVQVQGAVSHTQIVSAIEQLNQLAAPPDVLVITRGGGSVEDLQAFSTEQVTRAVAASRIPTVVAIGHEVDISLAELAADQRASTPSNAAELLVPDKRAVQTQLVATAEHLDHLVQRAIADARKISAAQVAALHDYAVHAVVRARQSLVLRSQLLQALDPQTALTRGYALVRTEGKTVRRSSNLTVGGAIDLQFADGEATAVVQSIRSKKHA